MDASWVQVGITILGSGMAAYVAVSVKLARHDERFNALSRENKMRDDEIAHLRQAKHELANRMTEHECRIEVLERT